jgi:hypothetical protein
MGERSFCRGSPAVSLGHVPLHRREFAAPIAVLAQHSGHTAHEMHPLGYFKALLNRHTYQGNPPIRPFTNLPTRESADEFSARP